MDAAQAAEGARLAAPAAGDRRLAAVSERISRNDVEHVARLARLSLSDEEIDLFTDQLGDILDHAARVSELATDDVPPTAHPIPLENVLRPDEVRPGVERDEVLDQAPSAEDHRFRVPRIMDES